LQITAIFSFFEPTATMSAPLQSLLLEAGAVMEWRMIHFHPRM
jgi:hypothetical protein